MVYTHTFYTKRYTAKRISTLLIDITNVQKKTIKAKKA